MSKIRTKAGRSHRTDSDPRLGCRIPTGRATFGKLGDADCRLFSIADYVNTVVAEVETNPEPYLPKLSSRMQQLLIARREAAAEADTG